jgi:ABC-type dipeptide/oligopeptide/nickel transport system permease component
MLRFITQRLFFIALVVLLIIFSAHLGMRMGSNSTARQPNYDLVHQIKQAWGDTTDYLSGAAAGNFGYIVMQSGPVSGRTILIESYRNSMGLLLVALVVAIALGLSAGAFAAQARRKVIVLPLLLLTILGISTPSFFAGLLLRQGELFYVRQFGHPLVSIAGLGWDFEHMLMPVLVLAARPLAYLTRAAYIAFDRIMEEDFIRTAYAKGLSQRRTVSVHALRNIAIPVLTAMGVSIRFSLSSLPVVEFLFVWPGLGLRMLEAINSRNTPLVVTLAAAIGLTFLLVNLLLDISYRFIDPRVREMQ